MSESTEDRADNTSKIPTWSGDDEKVYLFIKRFEAHAEDNNFFEALTENSQLPDKAVEPSGITYSDKQKAALKKNKKAMAQLTKAMMMNVAMNYVYESKTTNYPRGLAHKVWTAIKEDYKPSDLTSKVELRADLNKVKMKNDDHPKMLFEQIRSIQNKYNDFGTKNVTKEDLIATVIAAAPAKYAAVITSTQIQKGANLKIKDLEEVIKKQYWKQR